MEMLKRFYEEEDGMGTIEMVMIIAALMCVALLFRKQLTSFVTNTMDKVLDDNFVADPSTVEKNTET